MADRQSRDVTKVRKGRWSRHRLLSRLVFQPWFRWSRGMTLGVRAMVVDATGDVLLIRHSYWPGWHFPGGGVERGESVGDAVRRELVEEGGIELLGEPELFGIYSNETEFRGDHVAFFIVRDFRRLPFAPTREISEARFFSPSAPPDGTTGGTLRRLAEVASGLPGSGRW